MSATVLLTALLSISLSAVAQLALKMGSTEAFAAVSAEAGSQWPGLMKAALVNPFIITGFVLYGVGAVLWLLVLARLELSVAYPFVSLGFIVTIALGALVLNEPLGVSRIAGAGCIVLGVFLIARS
jgi:drug/metabolite transporter (DMT)-like permease